MKRAIVAALLFSLCLPVYAVDPTLSLEKRVVEHRLSNGITLLILERRFSPTVSIRMMFPTGSVDEVSGKTGLAHMFEHMLFKGTKTLGTKDYAQETELLKEVDQLYRALDAEKAKRHNASQTTISKLLERIRPLEQKAAALVVENELWNIYEREGGSNLNASTSRDYTQYRVDLPANKVALWAQLDADRLKNPVFRQFYSEREVVKEERRMRVDTDPDGRLFEQFLATAYMSHPYRNPTIGWESDIDRLHVSDLEDFYRRFYTPEKLVIALVGDIKTSDVIELVERHFGSWTPGPGQGPTITEEVPQAGERRVIVRDPSQPKLVVGYPLPSYPSRDHFIAEALVNLLTSGTTSRLYKALVEKRQLATAIDAFKDYPGNRFNPLFIISAVPRSPTTNAKLLDAIQEEIALLQKKPLETWELEKIRASTEMEMLSLLQSNGGMADSLVYSQAIFGDWRYLSTYPKEMANVSAEDIHRLAREFLQPDKRTVGLLEPQK